MKKTALKKASQLRSNDDAKPTKNNKNNTVRPQITPKLHQKSAQSCKEEIKHEVQEPRSGTSHRRTVKPSILLWVLIPTARLLSSDNKTPSDTETPCLTYLGSERRVEDTENTEPDCLRRTTTCSKSSSALLGFFHSGGFAPGLHHPARIRHWRVSNLKETHDASASAPAHGVTAEPADWRQVQNVRAGAPDCWRCFHPANKPPPRCQPSFYRKRIF